MIKIVVILNDWRISKVTVLHPNLKRKTTQGIDFLVQTKVYREIPLYDVRISSRYYRVISHKRVGLNLLCQIGEVR